MKTIEFLPPEYRHKQALHRAKLWWLTIAVLFGTGISLTAITQYGLRLQLQRQVAQFDQEFQIANIRRAELEATQKRLQDADHEVALYTYLRHPWPKSQILAAIVAPLPSGIRLTEFHTSQEVGVPGTTSNVSATTVSVDANTAAVGNSFELDMKALRAASDSHPLYLTIQGTATTSDELHSYVAQLHNHRLFSKVDLQSVETLRISTGPVLMQFQVRVKLLPGLGQPGGPHEQLTSPIDEPGDKAAPANPPSQAAANDDVVQRNLSPTTVGGGIR